MTRTPLHLLNTDDEYSGIVQRHALGRLLGIAFTIYPDHPTEATDMWQIIREIRATIPSSAWPAIDLAFPKADPSFGLDPVT